MVGARAVRAVAAVAFCRAAAGCLRNASSLFQDPHAFSPTTSART
ncbi:MAG: hypothetical protein QOF55_615 [Thermoleophilaceae bacterium]|jgi:hypothetical protein|nr:hypothetical protein [Thermoleophilaceae bacterium]